MRSIKDELDINQKKILLRLDLNVPLNNLKITDFTRIEKILPTINFLLKKNAKIIILSHIGRPKGKVVNDLSLKPVCEVLKDRLKVDIKLIKKNLKEIKSKDLFTDRNEKIIILENLRFYKEEEENDVQFAKTLASLADIYVNDAFSCSHRAHASISEITKYLPSFSGLQLNIEVNALTQITTAIKRPITCIIGGSKISTKINVIKNLITKFDNIVIVGGMANNILKYKGHNIGKSIQENNCDQIIKEIFSLSKNNNCKIIYPQDVAVSNDLNGSSKIKEINAVSDDELILDIGPKTINNINEIIGGSKTILWNGPAGYFENPNFSKGSIEIAKKIIEKNKEKSIFSVAGGGDTVAFLNKITSIQNFDFVSTAGGAFLEYLEGKDLPGIKALN
ncbi:MAG: phosphoglycerate kinase [Candidatus Pelagibacter sp. TMED106]|nr:MAG: phosphoglycerate kinase [Candidatus Pelagibacter sp. TMED106]